MRDALLISLGHGSSAMYIKNGVIENGYQNERLSRIKGDSRFPKLAIEEIRKFDELPSDICILISHWEPLGDLESMSTKHYDPLYFKTRFPKSEMWVVDRSFTHHDAHAYSALAYNPKAKDIIVADGFGNMGEVISVYSVVDKDVVLTDRVRGYNKSLGLLYQYATDYVGLKMNQDEWKLNAMSCNAPYQLLNKLDEIADAKSGELIDTLFNPTIEEDDDPVYELGALAFTHKCVHEWLAKHFEPTDKPSIAYVLQRVVQRVIKFIILKHNIRDVTVVGGCFMNVQLNGYIKGLVDSVCIMPWSGDNGAPLGVYRLVEPDFTIPDDLCISKRVLTIPAVLPKNFRVVGKELLPTLILDYLMSGRIVNVVKGKAEFGERAYCNTSTLALPTKENARYINSLNDRSQAMPMCPVMTTVQAEEYLDLSSIVRSVEHMIIAVPFKVCLPCFKGIAHPTTDGMLTARPQVVSEEHWLHTTLVETGPLINTSFNNHGQPIVLSVEDALEAHDYMSERDVDNRMITLIERT